MALENYDHLPYRTCVGVVMIDGYGRIFAGERIDTPAAWQMPQGGVDAGEDPAAAALRELREETGVSGDLVEPIDELDEWLTYDLPAELVPHVWNGRFRGQRQRWFMHRFSGTDEQINIATQPPEFQQWRWMESAELIEAIVPFKRDIYRRVLKEFSWALA
ncbi:RNA pyrophosphohydrolase [Brevirhabdus sp.]|uniref:RNA pyrophosphohydrolase n=1 Tax=Brevirhabdus sp. TaxID=2004514 RepID=UPI004057D01C